jgi:hypothetical protein
MRTQRNILFMARLSRRKHRPVDESVTEIETDAILMSRREARHLWIGCEGKFLHLSQMLSSNRQK